MEPKTNMMTPPLRTARTEPCSTLGVQGWRRPCFASRALTPKRFAVLQFAYQRVRLPAAGDVQRVRFLWIKCGISADFRPFDLSLVRQDERLRMNAARDLTQGAAQRHESSVPLPR